MLAPRSSTHDPSARGPDLGRFRSTRRWGFHVGLAGVLALLMIAIAAPTAPAQQQEWDCTAFGYLFQSDQVTHTLQQVDLATGEDTLVGELEEQVNAVGFNPLDNFFYGRSLDTNGIVRVNPDLTVTPVTTPATLTTSVIGDFDPEGHYWTWGAEYQEIDYAPGSPTYGQILSSGTVTVPPGISGGADWAWIDGFLYMVGFETASVPRVFHLLRMDPSTGVLADVGPLTMPGTLDNSGFGAVYADGSGYLYASDNTTGNIYRIDPTTRQTIVTSDDGPSAAGNDGARCASALVPTITVTKTLNGRVRPADQFTVGLRRPDGSLATTATTSGTATTASTVNFPASQGQTYTITDAMATGSPTPLDEYVKSIACTDADGNAVATGGSGPTWTLNVGAATFYTCDVTNLAVADLELTKSATTSPVVPGDEVTWSLTVKNNGPSTSIGETISDQLPAAVTYSSASPGCSEASSTVTCAVGELAPGASRTFTITGQVASDLDECLRNTGTVSGRFDPDTRNNSATICTPIEGRSNVSITKAASSATVAAGGQVMYTLVVRNNGPSDDPGVTVTDPLPAGLTLVSADPSQGSCTPTGNVVSCDLGALRDRGSAQVLVTANVPSTGGCLTNTARVLGAHEDPNADNNQASARICVDPPPPASFDLEVDKRASADRPRIGQRTTYRIVVTNKGPGAAQDAKVTDTFNSRATVVSVRTPQGSCTRRMPITCELGTIAAGDSVTITVVIRPRELGRARNAASATACCGTDTTPGDNLDTADVRVRRVSLRISKSASRSNVQAGERFSYRIRVRNPGKGEARNVKVCDRLPSGLRFVGSEPRARRQGGQRCWTIKRLKAGKSKTFRVTVQAARGAIGRKVNRATATSPDARRVTARHPVRVRGVATPVTG